MTRRRVLHVTQVHAGGISRAIRTIVELSPEVEHHLLWAGDEAPDPEVPFASVHEMPQSPRRAVSAIRRLRAVASELVPDVVHAHSSFGGVYARMARLKQPVYYQPHCYKFDDQSSSPPARMMYRMAEKLLAKRSAKVVVLSPHEERLTKRLDPNVPTEFLPNAATVIPLCAEQRTGYVTADTVIMIGRVTGQKDPEFFAKVARTVRRSRPDTHFVWIGDVHGFDKGSGAQLRQVLVDAGVKVRGWLHGADLSAELARPGLYLHTAHYEGFPLSLLDAAAFEHPAIVRDIPTFEGMLLPSAISADESADLVVEALDGGPALEAARAGAASLNEKMNHQTQREALVSLYDLERVHYA